MFCYICLQESAYQHCVGELFSTKINIQEKLEEAGLFRFVILVAHHLRLALRWTSHPMKAEGGRSRVCAATHSQGTSGSREGTELTATLPSSLPGVTFCEHVPTALSATRETHFPNITVLNLHGLPAALSWVKSSTHISPKLLVKLQQMWYKLVNTWMEKDVPC